MIARDKLPGLHQLLIKAPERTLKFMLKKKINKIIINYIPDYDADLDWLGKFSQEPGKFAVKHDGDRNSYPYFNAANVENIKEAKQNYKRIMEFENGSVQMLGIKATAEIYTSIGGGSWLINKVSSGGLWGIESDNDESSFKEIEANQIDELKDALIILGFTQAEIKAAPMEAKKN
jgi:hypothetical protein